MTKKGQKLVWHGKSRTRAAAAWYSMWRRVNGLTEHYRRNYKDRGIQVCQRWESLIAFIEDMGECPPGLTLERRDTNGNYELTNCLWVDKKDQAKNRRTSVVWTIHGAKFDSARSAGFALGVSEATIRRWCGVHDGSHTKRADCFATRVYPETLRELEAA